MNNFSDTAFAGAEFDRRILAPAPLALELPGCIGCNNICTCPPLATPRGRVVSAPALRMPVGGGWSDASTDDSSATAPSGARGCMTSNVEPSSATAHVHATSVATDGSAAAENAVSAGDAGVNGKKYGENAKRVQRATAKKANAVLEWSDVIVRDLMTLRYETYVERFRKAKNNAALKEVWLLLATELSDNQKMPISSEQCENKLKSLKRKWAEYNADVRATGNSEVEVLEPPGLDLMREFWAGYDNYWHEKGRLSILRQPMRPFGWVGNPAAKTSRRSRLPGSKKEGTKKRKTMGDSLEIGTLSIAAGLQTLAAAMAPPPTGTGVMSERAVVDLTDSRFNEIMQQLAQMKIQNERLADLIVALQCGNSN